ncbi:MAG: hypothetical protein ABIH42_05295 [Planctomycetota bacterium]
MKEKNYLLFLMGFIFIAFCSYLALAISITDYNLIYPAYMQNISATNTTLPFSFTYTNSTNVSASCVLKINTTNVFTNTSVKSGVATVMYSNITFGADGLKNWTILCANGTSANSTAGYFYVDTTAPTFAQYTVANVSGTAATSGNMVARINYSVTDAYLVAPTAYVSIFSNGTLVNRTGAQTTNDTGLSVMYQMDLAPSDIPYDGVFTITPHSQDTLLNTGTGTNQTNWTKTSLYTGWNLIQIQENITFYNVSQYSNEITQVSWWNTTDQTYLTYTVGASTNIDSAIKDGDAVYVYSKADVGLMRKWSMNMGNSRNLTLALGWNQLSAFNSSIQLYDICKYSLYNASAAIKAVSFYDASVPVYYTQVCSITLGSNNNVTVPRGKAFWLNVNTTTSYLNVR